MPKFIFFQGIDELKQEDIGWMDINDFAHYVEAQKLSPEEAKMNNLDGHFSVLQNHVNMNKNDVKAWIEFIEIQVCVGKNPKLETNSKFGSWGRIRSAEIYIFRCNF